MLETCDQLASVPSKSIVACVPSQKGLFEEPPQRQRATGSGCSMTCPSGAVIVIGPETMLGPSSLGVMLDVGHRGVLLGDLDCVADG
jgi:hypothetical protein